MTGGQLKNNRLGGARPIGASIRRRQQLTESERKELMKELFGEHEGGGIETLAKSADADESDPVQGSISADRPKYSQLYLSDSGE